MPSDATYHHGVDELPTVREAKVEPKPPSCEKDTSYLGYRGKFAYHFCSCCGRLYAVDAYADMRQFKRDDGRLVLKHTKKHSEISTEDYVEVRR